MLVHDKVMNLCPYVGQGIASITGRVLLSEAVCSVTALTAVSLEPLLCIEQCCYKGC